MRATRTFLRPLTALLSAAVLVLAACGDQPQSITAPDAPGPLLAKGVDSNTGASIETNKDDYVPGEIVHVVLKGWAPGEDVRLFMTEDPDTHGDVDTTVTVNAAGEWSGHFYDVQEHDLGVTFTLTATGLVSRSSATAVFYDGNITGASLTLGTTPAPPCTAAGGPYTVGQSLCVVASLTITGGGNTSGRILWTKGTTVKSSTELDDNPLPTTQYSSYSPDEAGTDWSVKVCSNTAGNCNQVGTALTFTVGAASVGTTTEVTASPSPSVFGQSVTFTAVVTPTSGPAATGTVNFYEFTVGQSCTTPGGATALGADASAPFEYTTSALSVGAHTIWACYVPDAGWTASADDVAHTVNKANTLVTLSDDPDPSVSGQSVTLSATVEAVAPGAGTPTGTVTFYASGTCAAPGTSLGSDGSSPWSISTSALTLAGSPYTLLACYGGDDNFNGNGDTESHTVTAIVTTTSVGGAPNPSVTGQSVTFTATVLDGATPVTTGTVDFRLGGTDCASGTLFGDDVALNGSGQATANRAFDATETGATIRACYSGGGEYAASSGTTTQTVNKANTLVTLSDDVDPTVFGQSVTLSATVAAVAPGAGTPTGTVTFYDGGSCGAPGNALGSDNASPWSISVSSLAVAGSPYTLLACYGGDDNFNGNADTESHTVNKANTLVTLSATPDPSTFGESVSLSATVAAVSPGAGTPTGTVTFYDGGTCAAPGNSLGSDNSAPWQASTAALAAGSHTLLACYSGDDNFNANSDTEAHTVDAATITSTVSVRPNPQQYSDKVGLRTVLEIASPGTLNGETLTGSVEFFIGTRSVGSANVSTSTLPLTVSLTAPVALTEDPTGSDYTVAAVFTSANGNFTAGTQTDADLTVLKEDATVYDLVHPDAVQVDANTSLAPAINLSGKVKETLAELNALQGPLVAAGDITKVTSVTVRLEGVSAGGSIKNCDPPTITMGPSVGSGYDQHRTFDCTVLAGLPVDTYEVIVTVVSDYYVGEYRSVLTVFDPSLGFITGGGTFSLDGDKTNFGFVGKATVQKKNTVIKGSLLVIRHLPDGSIVRIKSNVFDGLAIMSDGSATFSGKANNSINTDNLSFTAYVKDVATPGAGSDLFALFYPLAEIRTIDALNGLVDSAEKLTGGNIQVPQPQAKGKP